MSRLLEVKLNVLYCFRNSLDILINRNSNSSKTSGPIPKTIDARDNNQYRQTEGLRSKFMLVPRQSLLILLSSLLLCQSSRQSSVPLNLTHTDIATEIGGGIPLNRPFAARIFLTTTPNVLNIAWSCFGANENETGKSMLEATYHHETMPNTYPSSGSQNCMMFMLPEFVGKEDSEDSRGMVCTHNITVPLRKSVPLSYRVSCNGTFSPEYKVRYKYWDDSAVETGSDDGSSWTIMAVGSLGFYNTTKVAIGVLEEVSRSSNENVLWAIPGGLVYDKNVKDTNTRPLSESESVYRWLLWLQLVENITSTTPVVAAMSVEDGAGYIPSDNRNFSTSSFDLLLEMPYYVNGKNQQHRPWFSINHGKVHVVSICSSCDLSSDSEQYRWLDEDLRTANGTDSWIMVMGHEPLYDTTDSINKEKKSQLDALFAKYNVDFAVWSHERWYDRTMPIRNSQVTDRRNNNYLSIPNGTIHYTCGTGGMPLQQFNMDKFNYSAHYIDSAYGVCTFSMSSNNQIETMFVSTTDGGKGSGITQYDHLTVARSSSPSPDTPYKLSTLKITLITATVVAFLILVILSCFISPQVVKTLYPAIVVNKIRNLWYDNETRDGELSPESINMIEDPSNYGDKVMLIEPSDDEDDATDRPPSSQ